MAPPNGSNGYARADRSRGYRPVEGTLMVEVYDLDLAAYLSMRNVPLAESVRNDREFVFSFHDPQSQIGGLAVEYVNSESARFADAVRRLKKVTVNRLHARSG